MSSVNSYGASTIELCWLKKNNLNIKIETPRLVIKSFQFSDVENSCKLYGNKKLTKLFDSGIPRTREEVVQLVEDIGLKRFSSGSPFGLFSIFTKETNEFVGHIDLLPCEEAHQILEVGVILDGSKQKYGYCEEALKSLLLDYVPTLKAMGCRVKGIMATAHPDNAASIKQIKKVGMVFSNSLERFGQPRNRYFLFYNAGSSQISSKL